MKEETPGIEIGDLAVLNQLKIVRFYNQKWKRNRLHTPQPKRPGLALASSPENMDNKRLQILGKTEMGYLHSLSTEQRRVCLEEYLQRRFPAIMISSGLPIKKDLLHLAAESHTPVLLSSLNTSILISRLSAYLFRHFSKKIKRNGVMLDILGLGVMLTGASGVGKSETAMELINKGYHLISDDVVEFYLNNNDEPVGCSNPHIQNLMEVRGLGIINIKDIFGPLAVKEEKKLDLVIQLERWDPKKKYDRLGEHFFHYQVLEKDIPLIVLPVAPGRNVSTIIELAVRYFILRQRGKKTYLEKNRNKSADKVLSHD